MIAPYAIGQTGQHRTIGDAHCRRFIGCVDFRQHEQSQRGDGIPQGRLVEGKLWFRRQSQETGRIVQSRPSGIQCRHRRNLSPLRSRLSLAQEPHRQQQTEPRSAARMPSLSPTACSSRHFRNSGSSE